MKIQEENKCGIIADYENLNGISPEERCTEYNQDFQMYMLRLDVTSSLINERYAEAKSFMEGRVVADGRKMVAVFQKTLAGNIRDNAKYALTQEEEMLRIFYETEASEKKLGMQIGDDTFFLIRQERGRTPEMITLPFGMCEVKYMERLDGARSRWLSVLNQYQERERRAELSAIASAAGSSLAGQQPAFNYAKEIRKRMQNCDKVFREERMEGYDFRETDLQDAVFMNCRLAHSNFSGVNLENVFFFNCDLRDCLWYGAQLNNCFAYTGGRVTYMRDFTATKVREREWDDGQE